MQVKDESPEHHELRAKRYIKAKGWDLVGEYGAINHVVPDSFEQVIVLGGVGFEHITQVLKMVKVFRNTWPPIFEPSGQCCRILHVAERMNADFAKSKVKR